MYIVNWEKSVNNRKDVKKGERQQLMLAKEIRIRLWFTGMLHVHKHDF